MVTASGRHLAFGELHSAKGVFLKSLERALKAWEALPESERKPGAVSVPEKGEPDPKRQVAVKPPAGTLIVRVHNRHLGRTDKGEWRHAVAEDYIPYLRDPRPGQQVPVPATLAERIFRFHLDPARGLSESNSFDHVKGDAGRLTLTVESVTEGRVRLRLDGFAKLYNPRRHLLGYQPLSVRQNTQSQIPIEYDPRLLGYIEYDPARKALTRFEVIAVGDVRGGPVDSNLLGECLGEANPLGIAFVLVTHPTSADYVSPRGLRTGSGSYDLNRFFGLPK